MSGPVDPQWYKSIWTLDIIDAPWVEQTTYEVDFVVDVLQLQGHERILDMACGFGRHALALARRGYSAVGVDITEAFVEKARQLARESQVEAEFLCADLRDVSFHEEFDAVINLGDGAIGYLENDEENLKLFDLIASALKPGGQHMMSIPSASYARKHFPRGYWEMGERAIILAAFDWDAETSRNLYTGHTFKFGEILTPPEHAGPMSSTRLYSLEELRELLQTRHMEIKQAYGGYDRTIPPSEDQFTTVVHSQKQG